MSAASCGAGSVNHPGALDGATEAEVFGDEAPLVIDKLPPVITDAAPERAGREAPRPLPRPGFGTAE